MAGDASTPVPPAAEPSLSPAAPAGLEEPLLPLRAPPAGQEHVGSAAQEAYRLASLGWPLIVEEVVTFGATIIAIGMVGRLGSFPLSVFSLARSVTNITGLSFLVGVTGGIDTLCSQTHGAGRHRLVGITLQRGVWITLACCLPVLALYTQVDRLLLAMGQEAHIVRAAGRYIRLYSPYIPIHGINLCIYRYLIAQGAVAYVMLAGVLLFASAAPINWLLIFRLGWGLDGSALAAVAGDVVYLAALCGFAAYHNLSQPSNTRPWQGWSWEAFSMWGPYLRISVATTLMVALDWWIYDVCTLLAGMLPNPDLPLAAMGIAYNVQALAFMVPFGLGFAVCARVGSSLGAGRFKSAKLSAEVGTGMAFSVMALASVAIMAARNWVGRPFSRDPGVLSIVSTLVPPLALAMAANGGTAALAGVLRGCGRQKYGAWANLFVNWVLGLGCMVVFAFRLNMGVVGLWWGLCLASFVQVLVLALLVARFDWSNESARAGRLVRRLSEGSRRLSAAAAAAAAVAGTGDEDA